MDGALTSLRHTRLDWMELDGAVTLVMRREIAKALDEMDGREVKFTARTQRGAVASVTLKADMTGRHAIAGILDWLEHVGRLHVEIREVVNGES